MIDLTGTDLTTQTAVELREIAKAAGVKGASKGRKADLLAILFPMQVLQVADRDAAQRDAEEEAAKIAAAPAKRSSAKCTECGRKEGFRGSNLCDACREYGEAENMHSDHGHAKRQPFTSEQAEEIAGCAVCHPELDPRKPRRAGRSRAGMVIVAKGSEIHKSETFRQAAEKLGWTVTVQAERYELKDGEDGGRYFATAKRNGESISLSWEGRAYDYPNSSAQIAGKDRKVRNLKEALRLLAA